LYEVAPILKEAMQRAGEGIPLGGGPGTWVPAAMAAGTVWINGCNASAAVAVL